MKYCKIMVGSLSLVLAACAAMPEHKVLSSANTEYEKQIREASFFQSYLNNPDTGINELKWMSTAQKVKERDIQINACLHNARLYNVLAPKFTNLGKSWLPKQLDENRCLPTCDGDSQLDKTCYKIQ